MGSSSRPVLSAIAMPNFLHRRTQRSEVSITEKVIGAMLLVLLGAILAAIFVTVSRDRGELFAAPTEQAGRSDASETQLLAGRLLPASAAEQWQLDPNSVTSQEGSEAALVLGAAYHMLAPADGSANVRIHRFADAASARQTFLNYKPFDVETAESILLGLTGQTTLGMEDYLLDDKVRFWSGRHYTEVQYEGGAADDRAAAVALAAALAERQLAYGPPAPSREGDQPSAEQGGQEASAGAGVLPTPPDADWKGPEAVRVFGPANLYEKINGRAGLYFSFGFVKLTFGTYRHAKQPDQYVDCYIYDMGELENAFGMFKVEQGGDTEPVQIGREGYVAEDSIFFWKGSCYVQLLVPQSGEAYSRFVPALAEAAAELIEDDGRKLWADALLPQEDRIDRSFAYVRADAFSLDFLKNVYTAEYQAGEATWTLFVHRASDDPQPRDMLSKYADYLGKYGKVEARSEDYLVGEVSGYYDAVFAVGQYFAGLNGCADRSVAESRARALREALQD